MWWPGGSVRMLGMLVVGLVWCTLVSNTLLVFFFSSRRRHTRLQGDWSSDVCSSDLLHIFAFSKRPGTKAASLSNEVPGAIIKRRARELRALSEAKSAAFRQSQFGRTDRKSVV